MRKYKNNNKKYNINKRITILEILIVSIFIVMLGRICYLNILRGDYYKMLLTNMTNVYVYGDSTPRGRIYDRNMKLLVDNKAVKSIYYKKEKNITINEEIELAYFMSSKINLDYNNVTDRVLKEFFILKHPDISNKKIKASELEDLKNRKLTEDDIYELKIKRITKDDLKLFNTRDKKSAYLYYLMNKGYSYDEKIIKKDVSDKEYAYISENISTLKGFKTKLEWERKYLYGDTLRNIFGKVSESNKMPEEDLKYYLSLGYSRDDRVGLTGLEKQYESILKGTKDKYKVMEDNSLKLVEKGSRGSDIVLSIDIDLQLELEKMLEQEVIKTKKEANTDFYTGSFITMQKPSTGEIYAMLGEQVYYDKNKYKTYNYEEGNMLMTITPGSVVKGASMIVGYNNKAIDIGTSFYDNCIYLYNLPEKCSWKTLGYVNDLQALQYSSNVYQYLTAMRVGGFTYYPHKKLKINEDAFNKYRSIYYQFGLGTKTGIDYPKEETGYKGTSKAGDLLINFAIGQYDTYTPLQLSQYISTVANDGTRIKPRFLKSVLDKDQKVIYENETVKINKVETKEKYMKRIQKGFRLVMTNGTGAGYIKYEYDPAGKTGTSESMIDVDNDGVVDNETVSNNFITYAPFNKPIVSIMTSSPNVQNPKRGEYKSDINYRLMEKSSNIFFKYYTKNGERRKNV